MEANEIKSGTLVISVLGIAAIELAARVLISRKILAPMSGVGLARVAEIFFLLALIKFREKRFSIIGLASTTVYKGFKRGLIWSISFGAGAAIVLFIIYLAGIKISALFWMRLPTESSRLIAFLLAGVLVGPIAEEIFFRGILYGFFRRWGIPFAVILSTLLFVLPHAPSSGPAIPVTQLIGGILFAVSYEIEKNLLVPITIHSLGNLAIFTLAQMI
jgi:membrane protease YdiL (CAAX protease family)